MILKFWLMILLHVILSKARGCQKQKGVDLGARQSYLLTLLKDVGITTNTKRNCSTLPGSNVLFVRDATRLRCTGACPRNWALVRVKELQTTMRVRDLWKRKIFAVDWT